MDTNRVHVNGGKSSRIFLPSLVVVLWMFCVGSALGVVYSTFTARQSTQQLELLRREAADLKVVTGQYLLEQSSLAAYSRVEVIARDELQMNMPKTERTVLVARK